MRGEILRNTVYKKRVNNETPHWESRTIYCIPSLFSLRMSGCGRQTDEMRMLMRILRLTLTLILTNLASNPMPEREPNPNPIRNSFR